ncbi:pseudaminic acid cytidylyltransferase [Neisseria sp. Ec49-e6-T10]|uniref:pseudaminic acid cytidylyltransferase n=1 Tax=Neisseria sp. Ec49-e6-T10 TaxID=3140744 RepID=UPI003EBF4654
MNIAIIPARGGSKRIPHKNIKNFCGKPMIAWPIEAALESNCFDSVIVSTDSVEIASVAQSFGAQVPFIRPAELSDDFTGTTAVIKHAVRSISNIMQDIENVCCLYATAPFVQPQNLIDSFNVLNNNDCDFVFSVTSFAFPIQRAIKITSNNRVQMFQPEMFVKRSQDLEEAYHDAGQFYWGTTKAWLEEKSIFSSGSVPFVLPRYRVQDIDTHEDWVRAEYMFAAMTGLQS